MTAITSDGKTAEVTYEGGTSGAPGPTAPGRVGPRTVGARDVLVNASPYALVGLLGETPPERPEGAQLKVNMLLRRLPRLRDASVDPREAFAGTFHIAESYGQLQRAYDQAAAGLLPDAPPSEIYCHTLTDPSVLSPELADQGMHTLTLFGLHAPARLFAQDPQGAKEALLRATLAQLDAVLAEPLADCLALDADGKPCLEAKSPVDLEAEVGLPGGHIFHRDLSWPYREDDVTHTTGAWGVGTSYANVFLCGAGAVRGGGVSGVPGHNAAMAVLEKAR